MEQYQHELHYMHHIFLGFSVYTSNATISKETNARPIQSQQTNFFCLTPTKTAHNLKQGNPPMCMYCFQLLWLHATAAYRGQCLDSHICRFFALLNWLEASKPKCGQSQVGLATDSRRFQLQKFQRLHSR